MRNALILSACLAAAAVTTAPAQAFDTSQGTVAVTQVVRGLDEPWGFAFLPEGGILVTERGGTLLSVARDGTKATVRGTPRSSLGPDPQEHWRQR